MFGYERFGPILRSPTEATKMLSTLKQRLFLKLPTNAERLYRFCRYYVDRHDGELNGDMDTNGEIWLARQICRKASVVFDVGANQGEWARRVLQENPHLQLHAFEPSNFAYQKLKAAVPGAICNHLGLSRTRSSATLHSFGEGHAMNSLYRRTAVQPTDRELIQASTESVLLDTLDMYCADRKIDSIDFLKIDIEGHDLEALRGGEGLLRRRAIRLIQFEYSGCNLDSGTFLADFFELLQRHGYGLAKLLPDALRPFARYHRGLETFRYQNWVAFPLDQPPDVRMRR